MRFEHKSDFFQSRFFLVIIKFIIPINFKYFRFHSREKDPKQWNDLTVVVKYLILSWILVKNLV